MYKFIYYVLIMVLPTSPAPFTPEPEKTPKESPGLLRRFFSVVKNALGFSTPAPTPQSLTQKATPTPKTEEAGKTEQIGKKKIYKRKVEEEREGEGEEEVSEEPLKKKRRTEASSEESEEWAMAIPTKPFTFLFLEKKENIKQEALSILQTYPNRNEKLKSLYSDWTSVFQGTSDDIEKHKFIFFELLFSAIDSESSEQKVASLTAVEALLKETELFPKGFDALVGSVIKDQDLHTKGPLFLKNMAAINLSGTAGEKILTQFAFLYKHNKEALLHYANENLSEFLVKNNQAYVQNLYSAIQNTTDIAKKLSSVELLGSLLKEKEGFSVCVDKDLSFVATLSQSLKQHIVAVSKDLLSETNPEKKLALFTKLTSLLPQGVQRFTAMILESEEIKEPKIAHLCMALVHEVLAEKLELNTAEKIVGRLFFVLDKKKEAIEKLFATNEQFDAKKLDKTLKQYTTALLNKLAELHPTNRKGLFGTKRIKTKEYSIGLMHENAYAIAVADALLNKKGMLHAHILDEAKELLIKHTKPIFPFDEHLEVTIESLKNKKIVETLSSIKEVGKTGDQAVRNTLCLSKEVPLSIKAMRQTLLATLFSRSVQIGYGTCHCYSISRLATIEDFAEVLRHGQLVRSTNGSETTFYATPKMPLYSLEDRIVVQEGVLATSGADLFAVPHFKAAFTQLGVGQKELQEELENVLEAEKNKERGRGKGTVSLLSVFKTIQAKKNIQEGPFQEALALAASVTGEMPLRRFHDNALGSMFFPLLTTKGTQITTFNHARQAIGQSIADLALQINRNSKRAKELKKGDFSNFPELESIRICIAPPSTPEKRYAEAGLYFYDDREKAFTKITDEKALAEYFLAIAEKIAGKKAPNKSSEVLVKIGKKISEHFKKEVTQEEFTKTSAYQKYSFTPFDFPLSPSKFDSFWSTYLKPTEKTGKTFSLAEKKNEFTKDLLTTFASWRKVASTKQLSIPAKFPGIDDHAIEYPGHAVNLTPNHSTLIPNDGETVEEMVKRKLDLCMTQKVAASGKIVESVKGWIEKEFVPMVVEELKKKHGVLTKEQEEAFGKIMASLKATIEERQKKAPDMGVSAFLKEAVVPLIEQAYKTTTGKEKLGFIGMNDLARACFEGLVETVKPSSQYVLHIGDALWQTEHKAKSYPIDLCLYPNLLTGEYETIYFSDYPGYSYSQCCQFNELSCFTDIEALKKRLPRMLLELDSQSQRNLVEFQKQFEKEFLALKNRKEEVALVLQEVRNYEELVQKGQKLPEGLQKMLQIRAEKQKLLKNICSAQTDPTKGIDATRMPNTTEAAKIGELFDSESDRFFELLRKEFVGMSD